MEPSFSFESLTERQRHLAALTGVLFAGVFFPESATGRTYVNGQLQCDAPLKYRDVDPLWED